MMFGPKLGTWWVSSKKDPRWNNQGRGYGLVSEGGPTELGAWIDLCRNKYGEPPDDAEQGFMKD
jgi:hypothetical protein